jgi:hypothetical protein
MDLEEFEQRFPAGERWFKVVSLDENTGRFFRRGLDFIVNGVTIDPILFNPQGECSPGGIYFASFRDIDHYCTGEFGLWIAPVSFPREHLGVKTLFHVEPLKVKANQLCLGQPIPLGEFFLKYSHENQRLFSRAVRNDYADVVEKLLVQNIIDPSIDHQIAIRWASQCGHTNLVRMLLADPRIDPSVMEQQALRLACEQGRTEVVKLLFNDPRVKPLNQNERLGVLYTACRNGDLEIVRLLLPYSNPSIFGQAPLRVACSKGHTPVVQLLLTDPRVDPSAECQEAIIVASQEGREDLIELLLNDPRVDPSAQKQIALRHASYFGFDKIVRRLMNDPRVDPSVCNQDALRWARRRGHDRVVQVLLTDPRVIQEEVIQEEELIKLSEEGLRWAIGSKCN